MPIGESHLQMHLPTLLSLCSTWWISPIATSMSRLFLLPVSLTVFSMCGRSQGICLQQCPVLFPHHGRVSLKNRHVRYSQPQQSTPTYEACDAFKCSKYHCCLQQNAICPLSGKSAHSEKTWGKCKQEDDRLFLIVDLFTFPL